MVNNSKRKQPNRFLCLSVLAVAITTCVFSQDARTIRFLKTEGDRYYDEEQYHLAIQFYREIADQVTTDAAIAGRLADCYRKTFNYPEAEAYYLKVYFLAPEQNPLSLYYYALMLKFNGSFDESIAYFDEFISRYQNTINLKEYVEQAIVDQAGCETAKEELSSQNTTKLIPLTFNTRYNDYAPAVRDSVSLVITSGRVTSNRQSIDERFGEAFTDNFYFQRQGANWVDRTKQLFSITNTRYNDGSGCFNSKGDKYYFTVCGMGGPQCKLFVTHFKDSRWSEPVALNANVNYKSSESKHPAVSFGGDTLIFSSDRTGGIGQFDLWMSIDAGDDDWGPPMNLGSSINTKLNELSPSLTPFSNVVFFASDGHEGYGGLDLYMAKHMSTGETILYNLGPPFNSNRDDCFASFSEHVLYWSSNRLDGQGGFDIVATRIPSVISFISKLSLKKRNASRDINLKAKADEAQRLNLLASRVEEKIDYDKLTYEKKQIVDQMIQNKFRNILSEPSQFNIPIAEFELLSRVAEVQYQILNQRKNGYLTKVTRLEKQDDLSITGILLDSLSGSLLTSHKILLTDESGEVLKSTRTNQEGKFKFTDVPGSSDLYLRLEKLAVAEELPQIKELSVSGTQEQQLTHFENIYFDFDHYRIRPESRKVLDELAGHLIQNPGVQVEIFAFADDRGTSRYNLQLTQKRGQAVADYLAQKGVDQTGLAIIAKGKQTPLEVDVDLQRQYNRRVEFYLNGDAGAFKGSARTYIVKKKTDWETVAQVVGVPKGELMTLNGATTDALNAFQPVRIPSRANVQTSDIFFKVF